MKKKIFIFAYYSYRDPVFQSAVLPYFRKFPEREKFNFILLTFEQKKYSLSHHDRQSIKNELKAENIFWYHLTWHSGKLKLIKKIYDTIAGIIYSLYLISKHRCRIIYSEGFPGAVIAHFIAKWSAISHIVHSYEPHSDYMIEGGVWNKHSWEARCLKYFEWKVGNYAFTIMTATQAMIDILNAKGMKSKKMRVPSCVDLDHFRFYEDSRKKIRNQLNLSDDKCLIVYIGKMGGMYWQEEIFLFFKACLNVNENFYFLFFTPDNLDRVRFYCDKYGVPAQSIHISFLTRDEVPHYLSASDFGFVPVKQYPSKRYCSPIKDGEYWACGLPIIIPAFVSDDYLFASQHNIGIVINKINQEEFEDVARHILNLKNENAIVRRKRCHDFVQLDRDIKKFQRIYLETFNSIN